MKRRIEGKRYLTVYEARAILEKKLKEEGGRASEIDSRVMSYLSLFPNKDLARVQEARESLSRLGLSEDVVVNLLNICPQGEGEIRSILTRPDATYDPQLIAEISSILKSFCAD